MLPPTLLLSLLLPLLLCPLLPLSSAATLLSTPIAAPTFVWLPSTNATIGQSANPGSPYHVLTLPLASPAARAFLFLTNLSPHAIALEWDNATHNASAAALPPLAAGDTAGYNVDNCTSPDATYAYAVWVGQERVAEGRVSGLCVDCVLNITFTADNRTAAAAVQQPTYALQYRDRDDGTTYTSDFVLPHYPTPGTHQQQPAHGGGMAPSLLLNFTFLIPVLSFNFYPTSILRLLPSTSSVTAPTAHYPMAAAAAGESGDAAAGAAPYSPPLLHIPYYYTDILNPSSTFVGGVVLTVIGGFSINPADLYCCYFHNAAGSYYSDCQHTNASDTFRCTIPPSVDERGYDGELFSVRGEYQPARPGWSVKGYYMRHLVPTGDDNDNTFAVEREAVVLKWWDVRGWIMRCIIAGGGVLVLALAAAAVTLSCRRWKERRQLRAMQRRASQSDDEACEAGDSPADVPYSAADSPYFQPSLNRADPDHLAIAVQQPDSPATAARQQLSAGIVPALDAILPPAAADARLGPLKVKVKNGRRQVRAAAKAAQRKASDMAEPLLYATSV